MPLQLLLPCWCCLLACLLLLPPQYVNNHFHHMLRIKMNIKKITHELMNTKSNTTTTSTPNATTKYKAGVHNAGKNIIPVQYKRLMVNFDAHLVFYVHTSVFCGFSQYFPIANSFSI